MNDNRGSGESGPQAGGVPHVAVRQFDAQPFQLVGMTLGTHERTHGVSGLYQTTHNLAPQKSSGAGDDNPAPTSGRLRLAGYHWQIHPAGLREYGFFDLAYRQSQTLGDGRTTSLGDPFIKSRNQLTQSLIRDQPARQNVDRIGNELLR